MTSPAISTPIMSQLDPALLRTSAAAAGKGKATTRAQAEDFEAAFLSSMFQHMFTNAEGDGPVGGGTGVGVWRSFLTDEFAKSFAKKGGIGLSDQVYQSLIAHQEVASTN
jgi:Rod binding domain-containing protein